jgi:membrane-associated protease RseP (regulator of RpoE activity)
MFTGSIQALVHDLQPLGLGSSSPRRPVSRNATSRARSRSSARRRSPGRSADGALGLMLFLGLIAAVNVFFGIFNLVPLPPLDGGHLAVLGASSGGQRDPSSAGQSRRLHVDPRALAAIAIPVLAGAARAHVALLWLDITDPIRSADVATARG